MRLSRACIGVRADKRSRSSGGGNGRNLRWVAVFVDHAAEKGSQRKLLVIGKVQRHNPDDMGTLVRYQALAVFLMLLAMVGCAPTPYPPYPQHDNEQPHGGGDGGDM